MMNLIRSPIERSESMFYYQRRRDRIGKKGRFSDINNLPPSEWFDQDFGDCVLRENNQKIIDFLHFC